MLQAGDLSSVSIEPLVHGRNATAKRRSTSSTVKSGVKKRQAKMDTYFAKRPEDNTGQRKRDTSICVSLDTGRGATCEEICRSDGSTVADSEMEQQSQQHMMMLFETMSDSSKDICLCGCHVAFGFEPDISKMDLMEICMDCLCYEQW
jgi:hypothetical protein